MCQSSVYASGSECTRFLNMQSLQKVLNISESFLNISDYPWISLNVPTYA